MSAQEGVVRQGGLASRKRISDGATVSHDIGLQREVAQIARIQILHVAKTGEALASNSHGPVTANRHHSNKLCDHVLVFVSPFIFQDGFGESDEALPTIVAAGGRTPTTDQLEIRHRVCGDTLDYLAGSMSKYTPMQCVCGGGGVKAVSPRGAESKTFKTFG